jgi:hypothetical protein
MNAVTYDRRNEDWEQSEDEQDAGRMPRRPRRQLFNKRSAALAAVVACAAGFYAGVRVEKGQLGSSSSTGGLASALASLRSGATGGRGAGATSAAGGAAAGGAAAGGAASGGAAGATRSGTGAGGSGGAGGGSFAGGAGAAAFAGGGFGGGSASFGTISSVKGRQPGQGQAVLGDEDHQEPGCKAHLATSGRHGRDPRPQELERDVDRYYGERFR